MSMVDELQSHPGATRDGIDLSDLGIDNATAEQIVQLVQVIREETRHHEGPLPPPEQIEHYEKTLPGAAERIMAMAEKEQAHRHDMEGRIIRSNLADTRLGMFFGFTVAVLTIGGGFFLIGMDKDAYGIATILGAVATATGVFVYGRLGGVKVSNVSRDSRPDTAGKAD